MCRYMSNREHLMVAIEREQPLHGQPLNDVLGWSRPASGPAATASRTSREHKWGLVLETIHFALARRSEAGVKAGDDRKRLQDRIEERPLLGDGAMGTQLMIAGLEQGNCGEAWNLTHPERVLAIQRRYAEAGSDCIITNTFGGSRIMLNRHGHPDDVAAINRAGVEIARAGVRRPGRLGARRYWAVRRLDGAVR